MPGLAPGHVDFGEVGIVRQHFRVEPPVISNDLGHRESVPRVLDRGLQDLVHGKLSEALVQFEPAVHGARHGNRERAAGGDGLVVVLPEPFQGQVLRRAPTGIQAVELPGFRVPDDGEEIAADAVARGLHQSEQGVGGNRRVHRGTALLENVQRDLGCQRLAGRRHAVRGDDFRTRGEGLAGKPVVAAGEIARCAHECHQDGRCQNPE